MSGCDYSELKTKLKLAREEAFTRRINEKLKKKEESKMRKKNCIKIKIGGTDSQVKIVTPDSSNITEEQNVKLKKKTYLKSCLQKLHLKPLKW